MIWRLFRDKEDRVADRVKVRVTVEGVTVGELMLRPEEWGLFLGALSFGAVSSRGRMIVVIDSDPPPATAKT